MSINEVTATRNRFEAMILRDASIASVVSLSYPPNGYKKSSGLSTSRLAVESVHRDALRKVEDLALNVFHAFVDHVREDLIVVRF